MAHKKLNAGLTQGGRVRMERMINLIKYNRIDPSKIVTHRFYGYDKRSYTTGLIQKRIADDS